MKKMFVLLLALISPAFLLTTHAAFFSQVSIPLSNTGLNSQNVAVPTQTIVVWTNYGSLPMSLVSTDGSFSSNTIAPGQSYSWTFVSPGTYSYRIIPVTYSYPYNNYGYGYGNYGGYGYGSSYYCNNGYNYGGYGGCGTFYGTITVNQPYSGNYCPMTSSYYGYNMPGNCYNQTNYYYPSYPGYYNSDSSYSNYSSPYSTGLQLPNYSTAYSSINNVQYGSVSYQTPPQML